MKQKKEENILDSTQFFLGKKNNLLIVKKVLSIKPLWCSFETFYKDVDHLNNVYYKSIISSIEWKNSMDLSDYFEVNPKEIINKE